MKIVATTHLKSEILDPQGEAILSALKRLGANGIQKVRQGKLFLIELDPNLTSENLNAIAEVCEKFLSNSVIEDFSFEVRHDI